MDHLDYSIFENPVLYVDSDKGDFNQNGIGGGGFR